MNNPAYEETQNNSFDEQRFARECVGNAAEDVVNGMDIHRASVEWGVPVDEIERFIINNIVDKVFVKR